MRSFRQLLGAGSIELLARVSGGNRIAGSHGTLGVITEVTLQCVPSFNLRVTEGSEPADA